MGNRPQAHATNQRFSRTFSDTISGYLYTLPFFALFMVFGLYPLLFTVYVSFFKWNILGERHYVGLRNYRLLLMDDPTFLKSIGNTFLIWFESVPLQILCAIVLAVLLNQAFLKGKSVFRFFIFLPNITSLVAVSLIFANVFGVKYGLINYLFNQWGIGAVDWAGTALATQLAVASLVFWRFLGFHMVIQLAGLQSIPHDLYEAATIDGANKMQQFLRITIPMLSPTIMFSTLIATTGGLQLFTEPFTFLSDLSGSVAAVNGGTHNQVLTVVMYLFKTAFTDHSFGYSSAIANLLLVIILLFALVNSLFVRMLRG